MTRTTICFVCLGNICRSPTAEAVMRALVEQSRRSHAIAIESAGTSSWHIGEGADQRTREAALARGLRLDHVARQFTADDFARFDHVIAMDGANVEALTSLARNPGDRAKISLLRDHDPASPPGSDVPDPYYGGADGFEDVLNMCESACRALLDTLDR